MLTSLRDVIYLDVFSPWLKGDLIEKSRDQIYPVSDMNCYLIVK